MDNFCVFILSHGRHDRVFTYETLKQKGYTGKIFIIVDDEDKTLPLYKKKYSNEIITFSKDLIAKEFDIGDSFDDKRAVVYARNATFSIAKKLNIEYFLQLDDDYTSFSYRFLAENKIKSATVRNFDDVVKAMLDFLEASNALTVAFSQGGDHFGGVDGPIHKGILRKGMNSFFIRTERPIQFIGRINEDVNAYVVYGTRGELIFTLMGIQLNQMQTQKSAGGMSEMYLEAGTYVKSFYTVMMAPSCVTIKPMGMKNMRLHHSISWENAVPKILNEKYKKVRNVSVG